MLDVCLRGAPGSVLHLEADQSPPLPFGYLYSLWPELCSEAESLSMCSKSLRKKPHSSQLFSHDAVMTSLTPARDNVDVVIGTSADSPSQAFTLRYEEQSHLESKWPSL